MGWNPLSIIGDGLKMVTGSDFGIGNAIDMENQKELQRQRSKLNREEMAFSSALQRDNSEWLMNRQYQGQVSGMKNAGLNPATANGTTPATPSLGTPSSGSAGPSAPVRQQADPLAMAQVRNIDANTELANAQAEKTKAETTGQENVNSGWLESFRRSMDELKSRADVQFSQSGVNQKRMDEISENIKVLQKTVDQLSQDIAESKQRVNESKARENFTNKQSNTWDRFIKAQISQLLAHSNYLNGQNAREGQMLLFNMSNSAAMADYYDNNSAAIRLQNQWNNFLMNQDMKYKEWKWWLDAGTQVLNCVGDNFYKVASGIGSFVPFTSHSYSSGVSPLGYNFGYSTINTQRRTFNP